MKFMTKLQKIKDLPNSKVKLFKLYKLAFSLIPNSEEQNLVKNEIDVLYNELKLEGEM